MYHLRKLKSLLLLLFVAVTAKAQIENGKVYNFVNIGFSGQSLVRKSATSNVLTVKTTDETSYDQLWYVSGNSNSGFTVRNLEDGRYLRSSNNSDGNNGAWTLVAKGSLDDNCYFECSQVGDYYTLRAKNTSDSYHYLHHNSWWGYIICWTSTETASQWFTNVVDIPDETLNANWEYLAALESEDVYESALNQLFTDNSCSELRPAYASYTKNQMMNDANYLKLSATLQKMVLKVLSGNWQETNYDTSKPVWESGYAKKYRVQLYEPYNNISAASKALSLNEHTNMNNPTGIFSGKREAIYVMVQGKINDGASLYLDSYTGHNKLGTDHKKGIQLTEGLNIIPSDVVGSNYFINYVVETFDTSDGKRGHEAKARSLKDYAPLKIHIEGGYINGYYNKVGDALYGSGDKNTDWEYIEARATQTDVTVLGKYMTLQFPLRDEDTEQYVDEKDGNKVKWHKGLGSYLNEFVKIEDVINSWDNVMMWERLLLGVLDENTVNAEAKLSPYSITDSKQVIEYTGNDQEFPTGYGDYYNIHGLAYGVGGSAYMYGSGDHSGYHYNTMGGIIQNMPTNAGSHWGPAHEIGHQHQNLLKIRKEMEVTNNLFSNVVLWYFGETTSRVNGTEGSLENILNNFNKEDGHYLTNNIWGMTQMYYKLFLYYHVLGHNPKFYPRLFEILRQDPSNGMAGTVDGEKAQLHIYKKMCQAAGEDLTEFFRAHGFLRPLDGFAIDDYGVSTFYMTQAQIDAAIAEVKSWNYKENVAVLFINDATGETIRSHKGDNLELYGETRVCAEVGGYASFEESITNAGDLEFTVSGKTVTVNKGGGVGYAIFNEKGEIIAFSDKKTFTVSDECATALMWGEATVKVVNADNSVVNVENVDEVASKYTLLGELITEADAELTYLDATNTKVGYYKEGVLTALQTARDEAKVVYDNQDTQSYTAAYARLYGELYAVTHDEYNRVSLMAGGTYRLKSRNTSNWMSVNGNNVTGETSNESSTSQQWVFEAAGEDDTYYIKNASTSLYIGGAEKNKQVATQAEAKAYKVASVETGVWTLQCQDSNLQWLNHNGGMVLGWNDGNDHNSQWYITFKSVTQDAQKLHELKTLVQQTKELIGEMAEVTPMQKQTLQTTSSSSPFYLSTNACHNTLNNASDGQGLAGLLDENVATYFHSDYNGKVSGTHYLQVDLGGVKDLSEYIFYYTTRDNGNNCPTTIEVWGSTDGSTFNDKLYTFDSGLPTDGKQTWESPMLTAAKTYSSLRFMVTAAEGGNKFFVMSRFGIAKCEATVQSMGETYTAQGLTSDQLVAAYGDIHVASNMIKVGGATSGELETLCGNLLDKYDDLLTIYEDAAKTAFTAKQAELQTWINKLNGFFGDNECGTVTPVDATSVTLSTTNSSDAYYLTGGPGAASEGSVDNLLKDDVTSYYVSNWSAQTEAPYLQVRLPEGKTLSEFTFTFTSRDSGNAPTPTKIVVSGSNDGTTFTPIKTFTKANDGFPEAANKASSGKAVKWESPTITAATAYRYLRFTVTESYRSSGGETDTNGNYHFGISKFGLGTPSGYNITLGAKAGGVTKELLLESYNVVATASAILAMATTEEQLQKAIDKLQEQKTALEQAQQIAVKYSVVVVGGNGNGGIVYNSVEYKSGAQFDAAPGLTAFTPISLGNGYTTGEITMEGTTITVTYQKRYTVQITGGEGEGRVVYNGREYENADIIEVLSTIDGVTATDVEGYTKSEVIVNHETGAISVTYTLDKSALNDLLGETLGLIYACNGFVNSEFVTEDFDALLDETNVAWTTAQDALETVQIRSELSDALNALQAAHDKLNTAKEEAIAEMQGQLSNLITETDNLVKSCYDGESFKYAGSFNVTEALITKTNEVLETATETRESEFNAESYESALLNLTIAKQNLATAIAYATLPVQLTFDVNSPVTYKITINRGGYPVLAYDSSSNMVAVNEFELGNKSHGWYFMATTDGKVRIMPYHDCNTILTLSTKDFAEGNSKVKGMAIDTEGYTQEWTITNENMSDANRNAGWYNITTINLSNTETTWYFSNHGGVSEKMGFYNKANDGGSLFMFRKIRVLNITDAYRTLYNYYTNEVKVASGNVVGMDDTFGYYSVDAANAYNTAYNEAARLLESSTATDDKYTAAYNALKTANEALVKKGTGKFYTIKNGDKNGDLYITGSTTSSGRIALSETKNADAIYYYDGNHLLSYSTGLYIGLNESDWTFEGVGSTDISTVEFSVSTTPGAFNICCGGRWLHKDNGYVNRCAYNTCGDAHNWIIEEVTELPVRVIGDLGFASFYAPVALKMPEGMTAYVVTGVNVNENKAPIAVLAKEGEVIPANTGVLLHAGDGNYNLPIANSSEAKNAEGVNLLHGTIDDQYIEYGNNTHYMLGYKDNLAGLYVVAKNLNPAGTKVETGGTHFKNNGFKSYLTVPGESGVNALRFFVETTEIDEMEAAGNGQQEAYIYDLQGRRVLNPTNGMYIVNGKKVVIK